MKMAEVTVVKEMKRPYWWYFLYLLVSTVNSAMLMKNILQQIDAYIGVAQGGAKGAEAPPLLF